MKSSNGDETLKERKSSVTLREERHATRAIRCGNVTIGGGSRISVQSMTNTDTRDAEATARQITALVTAGCDIVRCAVPDAEAARSLGDIKNRLAAGGIRVPVVADIHFDYRLALLAIGNGADKIRINPGNIGDKEKLREIADAARAAGIPIRIGVNSGSIEKGILARLGRGPEALARSALADIEIFESFGFRDLVVSVKSSDVRENYEAARLIAAETDCPQHIGITESGGGERALMKSAIGIGSLLLAGIGDTLRVSLTGDPVREVRAGRDILAGLGLLPGAIDVISCPTCGRCRIDLERVAAEVRAGLAEAESARMRAAEAGEDVPPLCVAVMGCAVNGPGEASHADAGVACGDGKGVIFVKGEITETVREAEIARVLCEKITGKSF
jgi:(E)-4-hydroxy-3-methylbut-2-enyl-diphosphate synthase